MSTLNDLKKDAKDILLEMKQIGNGGPTKENAQAILNKMGELQTVYDRANEVKEE